MGDKSYSLNDYFRRYLPEFLFGKLWEMRSKNPQVLFLMKIPPFFIIFGKKIMLDSFSATFDTKCKLELKLVN